MSRVIRFHRIGGPDVLQIDTVDVPAPGPGEVQLHVKAAANTRSSRAFPRRSATKRRAWSPLSGRT